MSFFLEALESVCSRPTMYVSSESFGEVAALALGLDLAADGGHLMGFREWLIVQFDGPNNLSWSALVLCAAFPDRDGVEAGALTASEHKQAIATLLDLVRQFSASRERDGVRNIYLAYESWLRKQGWYGPDSPDWYEL